VNTVVLSLETLLLNSQKKDKNAKRKEEAIEMFEGIALDAAGILQERKNCRERTQEN